MQRCLFVQYIKGFFSFIYFEIRMSVLFWGDLYSDVEG